MAISAEKITELQKTAKRIRYDIVMMIGAGKPGHLGGSCSIADIIIVERYDTNPHGEKWKAFGWNVLEIDGHNIKQKADALDEADKVKSKPVMIVANTIKSKGVPFAEGKADFHHGIMTQEQYETAGSYSRMIVNEYAKLQNGIWRNARRTGQRKRADCGIGSGPE
jgi:transketolase